MVVAAWISVAVLVAGVGAGADVARAPMLTVGSQAVTVPVPSPTPGSLGGTGRATRFDLEAGQAGDATADPTLGQDGSGSPSLSGVLECVPSSGVLAAAPTQSTLRVGPGSALLAVGHAGHPSRSRPGALA
jgi:hypothetical protein